MKKIALSLLVLLASVPADLLASPNKQSTISPERRGTILRGIAFLVSLAFAAKGFELMLREEYLK